MKMYDNFIIWRSFFCIIISTNICLHKELWWLYFASSSFSAVTLYFIPTRTTFIVNPLWLMALFHNQKAPHVTSGLNEHLSSYATPFKKALTKNIWKFNRFSELSEVCIQRYHYVSTVIIMLGLCLKEFIDGSLQLTDIFTGINVLYIMMYIGVLH